MWSRRPPAVYSSGRSSTWGRVISYLGPLLAVVTGIVHAAIAPVVVIGGVKPNLVLVSVILVTVLVGFLPGITWAFVAGVTANLLVSDPLGSMPLGMLLVAALVAGGARLAGRAWIYPVIAAFGGSILADVVTLVVGGLVTNAAVASVPLDLVLAAAVLNAAICGLLIIPARAIAARYATDDAPAW